MNNIKSFIKSLFQQFGLVDKKCVWIDGGLGSQIIGLLQYKFYKKKDNSFSCDVSFFKIPKSNKSCKNCAYARQRSVIDSLGDLNEK